ncbi:hypothetical protein [Dyella sp.]|uniref:hypothetical protein n=1 Tax=Dyella sp. TaxID=1869338 RepID=UPI002ED2E14E
MEAQTLVALPIVLAVELSPGHALSRPTLSRDEAAELAAHVAADLHALVPQVEQARLALAGALFDAVELLRPGFPVWATLDELARRVPRGHLENVVAFGTHEGHMPAQPLEPDPIYADGPMRFLPLSLLVPKDLAQALAEKLEVELVGRGEAGQRTADALIRQLGVPLEHVRYFSRNDVLALTCVQYEHVNLAPLWLLLEAALLTPYREEATMTARGLPLRYLKGEVRVQSPARWLAAQTGDPGQRAHDLAGIVFELRQYAALLGAHGIAMQLDEVDGQVIEGGLIEHLEQPHPGFDAPTLVAHEAAGLGVIAVTVAQRGDGGMARALAHAYPLAPASLGPMIALLAERYGTASDLHALGRVVLDAQGRLGAPATPLH